MKFGLSRFNRRQKKLNEVSYTISILHLTLSLLLQLSLYRSRMIFCDSTSTGQQQIRYSKILETRYGKLKGVVRQSDSSKHLKPVETYLGIPYAMAPTGINRFSPTRTPAPWTGLRVFDKFSPVCPQKFPDISNETAAIEKMPKGRLEYLKRIRPFLTNQSEDCLYLNIYVPFSDANEHDNMKRPILVYIHGGSYEWNAGSVYDGRILASYTDLIVVTLNYRLGLLGFLNANSSPYQKARVANYGLMDQIAALHWIQQNIEVFGGDPANVTLMGHGTGAACINFLMISPAVVPGLFHRTILLSGSALSTWALIQDPLSYSLEVARQVNCTVRSSSDTVPENYEHVVDCLRQVPLNVLLNTSVRAPTFLSSFGPSVDGVVVKTNYQEDILTKYLSDLQGYNAASLSLGTAEVRDSKLLSGNGWYDMLVGVVTSEALWKFSSNDIQSGFEIDRRDKILRTYVRNSYDYHLSEIFLTIVNEYTDWERTTLHPINIRDATVSAISDAQFVAPLVQVADLLTTSLSSPDANIKKTFFYVFDYQTKDGDYPQRMGTVHGEELPYAFGAPLTDTLNHFPHNFTKFEISLSEAFMSYIGNFVRSGNPNDNMKQDGAQSSKERNRFKNTLWEQYDPVHQKYLEIGTKAKLKNHFRAHQLSVWLRLIPELHRAGMQDVISKHNLFSNHDSVDLYEGLVRSDPLNRIDSLREDIKKYFGTHNGTVAEIIHAITTLQPFLSSSACINSSPSKPNNEDFLYAINESTGGDSSTSTKTAYDDANYNATLSLTAIVGCVLLVLNVMVFVAVYYQRAKTRIELKTLREQQQQMRNCSESPFGSEKFETATFRQRHYDASTIVDLEQDIIPSSSVADNNSSSAPATGIGIGATLPRNISSQTSFNYPTFVTMPRHYGGISGSKSHIIDGRCNDTIEPDKTMHYRQCTRNIDNSGSLLSPPNGSVIVATSLPKPPPPPKSNPPAESQPLLHSSSGGHHCHSNSVSAKPGILKVPTAAINEMRV